MPIGCSRSASAGQRRGAARTDARAPRGRRASGRAGGRSPTRATRATRLELPGPLEERRRQRLAGPRQEPDQPALDLRGAVAGSGVPAVTRLKTTHGARHGDRDADEDGGASPGHGPRQPDERNQQHALPAARARRGRAAGPSSRRVPAVWASSAAVTSSAASETSMPDSAPHTSGPAIRPRRTPATSASHRSPVHRGESRVTNAVASAATMPATFAQNGCGPRRAKPPARSKRPERRRRAGARARPGCMRSRDPRRGSARSAGGSTSRRAEKTTAPRPRDLPLSRQEEREREGQSAPSQHAASSAAKRGATRRRAQRLVIPDRGRTCSRRAPPVGDRAGGRRGSGHTATGPRAGPAAAAASGPSDPRTTRAASHVAAA